MKVRVHWESAWGSHTETVTVEEILRPDALEIAWRDVGRDCPSYAIWSPETERWEGRSWL